MGEWCCRAYIFPVVINYPVTFLCMCDTCVQQNAKHLWYKYQGLLVNSLVVIVMKNVA